MLSKPLAPALDEIHQGPDDRRDRHDRHEKDDDLRPARRHRRRESLRLAQIVAQLEDAEDPEEAERAHDQQRLATGEDHAQVGRQDGEQVDHPKEAEDIARRPGHAQEAGDVLDGEEQREEPLERVEELTMPGVDRGDAVEHHDGDAGDDHHEQGDVEHLPRRVSASKITSWRRCRQLAGGRGVVSDIGTGRLPPPESLVGRCGPPFQARASGPAGPDC